MVQLEMNGSQVLWQMETHYGRSWQLRLRIKFYKCVFSQAFPQRQAELPSAISMAGRRMARERPLRIPHTTDPQRLLHVRLSSPHRQQWNF